MRESRWPPPFTRALKRNLQGSFFVVRRVGVDEVLRGGSLGYFIGLIRAGGGEDYYLFDNILYKERYSIERINAWLDSYRSL